MWGDISTVIFFAIVGFSVLLYLLVPSLNNEDEKSFKRMKRRIKQITKNIKK